MDELSQALFLMRLKDVKRAGWVRAKVPEPESVAAHSYGAAALCIRFAKFFPGIDRGKLVEMAVVHDMGEAATARDRVADRGAKIDWAARKKKTKEELRLLPKYLKGKEAALFKEFESRRTPEAKALKEIEKLDMALQAFIYEEKTGRNMQEFFDSASAWIANKRLKRLFGRLLELRDPHFR